MVHEKPTENPEKSMDLASEFFARQALGRANILVESQVFFGGKDGFGISR